MSNTTTDVDQFLEESGGYPAVKFDAPGSTLTGDLIAARVGYQRVFGTKEVAKWEDGTPKKQLVLDIKIDSSETKGVTVGDGDSDTGTVYCKHAAKVALQQACEDAGIKLSQAGRIKLQRTEDGAPPKPGHNPPQQFRAKVWSAPQVTAEADDFGDW